jgi:hypothetical protein
MVFDDAGSSGCHLMGGAVVASNARDLVEVTRPIYHH